MVSDVVGSIAAKSLRPQVLHLLLWWMVAIWTASNPVGCSTRGDVGRMHVYIWMVAVRMMEEVEGQGNIWTRSHLRSDRRFKKAQASPGAAASPSE